MRENRLKTMLDRGETTTNGWLSIDSGYLAEVLSHSGFDSVTVDLQHGMFGLDTAIRLLQSVSAGPAVPLARTTAFDVSTIGKLLDAGAYGIICPTIDTAEQAAALVSACRYPPIGLRSFGPARALLYGGPDYVARADDTILVWAMIESATALTNLDAIVAVPGLDGIYVGPNDLALALGETPGQWPFPEVISQALERVVASCRAAGLKSGIFCADGESARAMLALGFDLVTPGNDVGILRTAIEHRLIAARSGSTTAVEPGSGY